MEDKNVMAKWMDQDHDQVVTHTQPLLAPTSNARSSGIEDCCALSLLQTTATLDVSYKDNQGTKSQ